MIVHTTVKVDLNEKEMKRWNDAYDFLCKLYEVLPEGTDAEQLIENSLSYIKEFAENYMVEDFKND